MNINKNLPESSSKWLQFFKDCNIPEKIANNYSILFTNNRMRFDMLNELNKELLHEIGICAIGDVLSILKHAKKLTSNSAINSDSQPDIAKPNVSKRVVRTNSNEEVKKIQIKNNSDNVNLSSNLMSRLKFKNETINSNNDMDVDDHSDNNNLESISIKTDNNGKRIVIKNDVNSTQNKLLSIKKPILKRKLPSSSTLASKLNNNNNNNNNNEDKQGQVALRLLGDFIKKPNNELTTNHIKSTERPILKRITF